MQDNTLGDKTKTLMTESVTSYQLSGKAEGRRQKASGNSDSWTLPVTKGNKGLRPPLNSCSVAPRQEGFESPSVLFLLPFALCLLPSSTVTSYCSLLIGTSPPKFPTAGNPPTGLLSVFKHGST
jgi:hypothetical protein